MSAAASGSDVSKEPTFTGSGPRVAHRRISRPASGPGSAAASQARRARYSSRRSAWQRGTAFVELAIVMVPLALIIFGAIDYARVAKFQNRLRNAAREGAAIAQYYPGWVGPTSVCGVNIAGRTVYDRATNQDPDLTTYPGFAIHYHKVGGSDLAQGCSNQPQSKGLVPGVKVEVVVQADFKADAPFTPLLWGNSLNAGNTITLKGTAVVEIQGAQP